MTNLLVLKEHLRSFYSKNEVYLIPLIKFLVALISLLLINGKLGYMPQLNHIMVVLILALMCSFLPTNMIIVVSALVTLLHLYKLSIECAAVAGILFLLLFLLYFRFSPRDTMVVILTPICFFLQIPYVIPLTMGLIGTPASAVSVGSGVIVYYLLEHIGAGTNTLNSTEADGTSQKFRYVIDGVISNKAMLVTIAAFAVTILLVYIVRRMSVDHSWRIAIIAGSITNVIVLLVGDLIFDTKISILATVIGTIASAAIAMVIQFFMFNLDYSRTETVQFEDDEYYYYVKAVPKITVSTPEKKVKKINPQRTEAAREARMSQNRTRQNRDY
ncbi:MAG: hypothetical protein PHE02_00495 [Lachnospiraceae bacterium]|nr:hypothetical protein [Lachnospiraceae bacterium]